MALRNREAWTVPFAGGVRETQPFGVNNYGVDYRQWGLSGHNGNDIVPLKGSWDVLSVDDGVVVRDEDIPKDGYGNYVTVWNQAKNIAYQYAHLEINNVQIGQTIKKGQKLGTMGNTGFSTGPHLHLAKYDTDANGMRLNTGNGFVGAVDAWQNLVECNEESLKKSFEEKTFEKDGKLYYEVQKGGWRSQVLEEMLYCGVLTGIWEDHDEWFNAVNPTPQGGWVPGDTVIVQETTSPVVVPEAPKPAWMAKMVELENPISKTVEKNCDMHNVITGDKTIPDSIMRGQIVSFTHEYGDFYMTQENVDNQQPVGYSKACIDYINEDIGQDPVTVPVVEDTPVEEDVPVVTAKPAVVEMPDEIWNDAQKYQDSDGVVFITTNKGNTYKKAGTDKGEEYTPVGEFAPVDVNVETVQMQENSEQELNNQMSAEFEKEKVEANTTDFVAEMMKDVDTKEKYQEEKQRHVRVLDEFIKQGDKKFPGLMQILRIAPIRKALTIIARYILFPFSAIQAGGNLLEGDMISWQEVLKLIDGLGNFFGF